VDQVEIIKRTRPSRPLRLTIAAHKLLEVYFLGNLHANQNHQNKRPLSTPPQTAPAPLRALQALKDNIAGHGVLSQREALATAQPGGNPTRRKPSGRPKKT
jgi:hypothetical protein